MYNIHRKGSQLLCCRCTSFLFYECLLQRPNHNENMIFLNQDSRNCPVTTNLCQHYENPLSMSLRVAKRLQQRASTLSWLTWRLSFATLILHSARIRVSACRSSPHFQQQLLLSLWLLLILLNIVTSRLLSTSISLSLIDVCSILYFQNIFYIRTMYILKRDVKKYLLYTYSLYGL